MIDRASYRNRGGLLQRAVTAWHLRHFTKHGVGNLIKRTAEFHLTDGAILEIGDNCTIQDYAYFQLTKPHPRVTIGSGTVIGRGSMITAKNLIRIGNDVLMGAFVQVIDQSHAFGMNRKICDQPAEIGQVIIGNDVWIGTGAKILMDVVIGDGAVIGANSVVTKSVAPYDIVAGVPANVIGTRRHDAVPEQFPIEAMGGLGLHI